MEGEDRAPTLRALLAELAPGWEASTALPCTRVTGISADTRTLRPGELFVALSGDHVDGSSFAHRAIERGACAVVAERPVALDPESPIIRVPDARRALSRLAAAYWGHPSRALRVVGVTGTDGKTTTSFLALAVLESGGRSAGLVTTVDLKVGNRRWGHGEHVTTPQPPELHGLLRAMVEGGNTHAVVESSSHGLRLARLEDVLYDIAVLTNVTSEHLELHGTVEQYRRDKARLFTMLAHGAAKGGSRVGIVNADDPNADLFLRATAGGTLTYGTACQADVVAEGVIQRRDGLHFGVRTTRYGEGAAHLPMLGAYNAYNALAAVSVGLSEGIALADCLDALRRFRGVPGRMQLIDVGQAFRVVVDYAHTADALDKALRTLRPLTERRLLVVFGSAGERDRQKRAPMGEVAARIADVAVIANEDPRGEDAWAILREIARGLERAGAREGERYSLLPDRREAIRRALRMARPGDTVLLAGKGHETTIETADGPLPWDEAAVARELLEEL